MMSKDRNFSSYNYYSMQDFCTARFCFIWIIRMRIQLKEKRYPVHIQNNPNIRPDWTPKSGSCTPLIHTWCEVRNFASHKFHLTPDPIQIQPNLLVCSPDLVESKSSPMLISVVPAVSAKATDIQFTSGSS